MSKYNKMICRQLNSYRESHFADNTNAFDRPVGNASRPPVFLKDSANLNVLIDPNESQSNQQRLLGLMSKRHRWFGSMKSSQALAQSIFGNLIVSDKLYLLSTLRTDENKTLFGGTDHSVEVCKLEYAMSNKPLKEVTPTEVDVFFPGEYQVAVECKFTEVSIGECSIPNRKHDKCDGNLRKRSGSTERCYLSTKGIKYWEYVPKVFKWEYATDSSPCPLRLPYQLVRNTLAACIREDGTTVPDKGHAVLVFDDRNPAFQSGGRGDLAWQKCKAALKFPHLLQKCSWQMIIGCLRDDSELRWLVDETNQKYGLR